MWAKPIHISQSRYPQTFSDMSNQYRSPFGAGDLSDHQRRSPQFGFGPLFGSEDSSHQQFHQLCDLRESFLSHTDFSLSFAKHVFSDNRTKNFVLSPLSIHVVLSLLAAGSNGPTRDQLLAFLRSNSIEQVNSLSSKVADLVFADGEPLGGPRLSLANSVWLWIHHTPKPAFIDIVQNVYKAACNQVDFQNKAKEVREEMNRWVDKETNGLIKDILAPGDVDPLFTRLIFANAVYFKGTWEKKFDESMTKDREFFLSNGTSIQAPFMTSHKNQYVRAFNGFKVLKLPYGRGNDERKFSMYIFLPDAKDGLPALLEKMGSKLGFINKHIPYQAVEVGDFGVPKFKIDSGFEASGVVNRQGVDLPFRQGSLTEIVDDGKDLFVSGIIHKAFIEVNEKGTEAAAATVTLMRGCCRTTMEEKPIDFVADHPFMFVIREDVCGAVLFVGQLFDPLAG